MRLALYLAPEVQDPLHLAAARWLGRDAETGAKVEQEPVHGVDIATITAEAASYGFHATLKPPFRLSGPYAAARGVAAALAERTAPFALPPLQITDLRGFLALTESEPCPALQSFADACVDALEPYRAAPTEAEIARRNPDRMTPRQREHLERWGYPYVFDEWFFHMTLTRRLNEAEKALVLPAAERAVGGAAALPRVVRELCLFTQAAPGAPFLIAERLPLGG